MPPVIDQAADLPPEEWLKLKQVAERFEDAWQDGRRLSIDDCLPAEGPLRRLALRELVHTELEYRLKAGEPARVEEYLHRYPSLRSDRGAVPALIAAEYQLRRRREEVAPAEYRQRFPEYQEGPGARPAPLVGAGETVARGPPGGPGLETGGGWPTVPGHEVLGELGRGGMGVVYRARQLSLGRFVALKMILLGEHAGASELARFRTEAEAVARLQHRHIVHVYEIGEAEGRPYLALELVEGSSLADQLRGRPWPIRKAARLVETLARAMHHAHFRGIVHRDLKPSNVLLTRNGGSPVKSS